MSQEIMNEVNFFLYSFAMGVIITFTYDWLLILRRLIKHGNFLISFEDLLFWIACAIGVFYMLYEENNGILRWFAVLGAAIGMFAYRRLLGRHFVLFMSKLLKKFFAALYKIVSIICKPIRKILLWIAVLFKKTGKRIRSILRFFKKKLTLLIKLLKITLCKRKLRSQEKSKRDGQ